MRPGIKILFISGLLLSLFNSCKEQPIAKTAPREDPSIVFLPGYNFKDTNFTRDDFNVFVITTEYGFDSLLVTSITNPIRPKFAEELVLAIKAETPNYSYRSTFRKMELRNRILHVHFTVNKEKEDAEGKGWVSVSTFPRDRSIRLVRFYFDNVLIRSIPVVLVY